MVTRKDINISGNYVAPDKIVPGMHFSYIELCTLYSKKWKGQTKSYFILIF